VAGREPGLLLEAKPVGTRGQRTEQQLVEYQNDHEHRGDRPADGREVLLLDGERDVGADARQGDRGVADADASEATTKNQPPDMDIIMSR